MIYMTLEPGLEIITTMLQHVGIYLLLVSLVQICQSGIFLCVTVLQFEPSALGLLGRLLFHAFSLWFPF